ncbi:hypothetical protein N483_00985 [Pseudoalteromonas luteoviolacea NCIMB 1944]|nr:hypothetical protein N483_00985 [Pseudoalteromonas luteoviolacea NCIMB 1944]
MKIAVRVTYSNEPRLTLYAKQFCTDKKIPATWLVFFKSSEAD